MPTPPTPITAIDVVPDIADPANFETETNEFIGDLPDFQTEANALADNVYDNAVEAVDAATDANTDAGTATTQAGIATTQAGIATTAAGTATTQAGIATTQAGIATTAAGTATTQAGTATTQAGVATSAAAAAVAAVAGIGFADVLFIAFADSPYTVAQATSGKLLSVDTSGGAVVVNMPAIAGLTLPFTVGVKKATGDANAVTINRASTDVFDGAGATSKTLTVESGLTLIPDVDTSPDRWTTIAFGGANAGAATSSGLTMATGKLLGRTTAGTGAIEELPITDFARVATANTFALAQEFSTGSNIASASTVNLDAATGNRVHITGTTTITAVTLTRGPRTVIFDGVLTLTHHATNNNLPGATNITTAAGDRATYESDGTVVYCTAYTKADGTAVVGGGAQAFGTVGSAVVVQTSGSSQLVKLCNPAISATRNFVLVKGASNYPKVAIVDATGAVLVAVTTLEAVAMSASTNGDMDIKPLSSTTAMVSWKTGSGIRAVVVTDAGASIEVGVVQTIFASPSLDQNSLIPLPTTAKVICTFNDTTIHAVVLTVSGTGTSAAISVATRVEMHPASANYVTGFAVSATNFYLQFNSGSTTTVGLSVSEAATVLTPGTSRTALIGVSNAYVGDGIYLTGTRGIMSDGLGTNVSGVCAVDVSTSTQQFGRTTITGAVAAQFTNALAKVSNSAIVRFAASINGDLYLEALSVSGPGITAETSVNIARCTSTSVCSVCIMGTNALCAYSDPSNSNYPTVKSVALGTVA